MKRIIALVCLFALPFVALSGEVTTNYFAGYVYKPNTSTNSGDTGLTTNVAYCCFPQTLFTGLTDVQANGATGDVRAVVYGFLQGFYTAYTNTVSSNRTATTITRTPKYTTSGTNVIEEVGHRVESKRTVGTATFE